MDARSVVFVGPSLSRTEVRRALPGARVEPPAARGDLERLCSEGARMLLLIDGVFAQRLAVSPAEVVGALRAGVRVIGAASIGAIRAAECWPAGMEGIGAVHLLYRRGIITDDDEVAIATDPDREDAAVSVAFIDVRFGILAAMREGLLSRGAAHEVLGAARQTHFSERRWETILAGRGDEVHAVCAAVNVKRRDALLAIERFARERPPEVVSPGPWRRAPRTRGHDPYLGYPRAMLAEELTRWLVESGRSQRYVSGQSPAELWSLLERTGALWPELMRWYALRRVGATGPPTTDPSTNRH